MKDLYCMDDWIALMICIALMIAMIAVTSFLPKTWLKMLKLLKMSIVFMYFIQVE